MAREVFDRRTWAARPLHLLHLDDELAVLHLAQGSTWLCPAQLDGSPHRVPSDPWRLIRDPWPYDNLWFVPLGGRFAVHTMRVSAESDLLGWYINVQEPIRPTPTGIEYLDQTLDVVVAPDLSAHELKDEDELAQGHDIGLYSHDDVATIRAAADAGLEWLHDHHDRLQRWVDSAQVPRPPLHLDEHARLVPAADDWSETWTS